MVTLAGQCVKRALPLRASQQSRRSRHRHVPAGTSFSALAETLAADQPACSAGSFADQQNSVPSIHIRWRMTASLRATATRALLRLFLFAMRMPQAFSVDHLATRVSSTLAAS